MPKQQRSSGSLKKPSFKRYESAFPLLSILTLSACGGSSETDGGQPSFESVSGAVVKGPLENALVFLDYDDDGVLDPGEPSVRSASDGSFQLSSEQDNVGFVAQTDSTTVDTSSGEVLADVVLKAPTGSTVIRPTTTIMKEANISKEEVVEILGLPESVDPTTFNPFDEEADPDVALAVMKRAWARPSRRETCLCECASKFCLPVLACGSRAVHGSLEFPTIPRPNLRLLFWAKLHEKITATLSIHVCSADVIDHNDLVVRTRHCMRNHHL